MFDLGIQELIVIFIVALIVFGPKRLPELGRTIGKGMSELKRAMNGVRDQMHSEFDSVNKTAEVHTLLNLQIQKAQRQRPALRTIIRTKRTERETGRWAMTSCLLQSTSQT